MAVLAVMSEPFSAQQWKIREKTRGVCN